MKPPKLFEAWGGPLCGERTIDPDDLVRLAKGHRGWYERWHSMGKYWLVWRDRARRTEVGA